MIQGLNLNKKENIINLILENIGDEFIKTIKTIANINNMKIIDNKTVSNKKHK